MQNSVVTLKMLKSLETFQIGVCLTLPDVETTGKLCDKCDRIAYQILIVS